MLKNLLIVINLYWYTFRLNIQAKFTCCLLCIANNVISSPKSVYLYFIDFIFLEMVLDAFIVPLIQPWDNDKLLSVWPYLKPEQVRGQAILTGFKGELRSVLSASLFNCTKNTFAFVPQGSLRNAIYNRLFLKLSKC